METEKAAEDFLKKISTEKSAAVTIVGLYGDLGSGKTTFTQAIAKLLGITDFVTSPTYVIEKVYPIQNEKFDRMIHIDLYRIESAKELLHLNWNEIIADPKNLIFIEWPEKISEIMPKGHQEIHFTFVSEHERKIDY
jgi:tRNA threonylcarbamoyladenosine biosynthesis protein TsaE